MPEAILESSTKEMVAVIKDINKDLSSAVMSMAKAFQATGEKNLEADTWQSVLQDEKNKQWEIEESWNSQFETLKYDN